MTTRFLLPFLAFALAASWGGAVRAQEDDVSELVVRLGRIEGQMRQMSGQVEQLQFENRQVKEQLRKFQEDVEFRLQERSGGRPAASSPPAVPQGSGQTPGSGGAPKPVRRGDAYEPPADAPPRQIAATPSNPSVATPANPPRAGRDAIGSLIERDGSPSIEELAMRSGNPSAGRQASVAATGGADAKADYDAAQGLIGQRQYDQAEMALRRFIQSHPRDRLVPDATYFLGESYLQRSRFREAAEQFLKVSTDYTRATKAPDALYKLGLSLAALGAKDQACATFAELDRKYPAASPSVKQAVDREQKKTRCPT